MDLLAPDVVLLADGGRVVSAARRPAAGADKVAGLLLGLPDKALRTGELDVRAGAFDGTHSVVALVDGELGRVTSIGIRGGAVTAVYRVRNPEKPASGRV